MVTEHYRRRIMRGHRKGNKFIALLLALLVGMAFTMADVQPAYAAGKPGAVKKVTVKTLSKTGIRISWSKAGKATGYQLFRNETLIKKGNVRSFTDKKLKPGLKYTYVVRAYRIVRKNGKTKYIYGPYSSMKVAATKGKRTMKKKVLKILVPKSEDKNVGKFVKRYNATDNPYIIKIVKTGTAKGIDPTKYDGLIIPGGKHVHPSFYHAKVKCKKHKFVKSLDRLEIALVKKFIKKKKPVLGICRGCQLINVTLGGTLKQDIGKGHYHDKSRNTKTKKGTNMRKLYGASVRTLHYHHQAIKKLAKPLKVTMVDAKDGTIEGVQHKTLPVYGIQYHPDRMYVKASPIVRKNGKKVMTYFFDVCYSKRLAKKSASAKPAKPATQPAQQPADTQTGTDTGTNQTGQNGQTDQTAGNSDFTQTDTQTADRRTVRILLYGSDRSSVEEFAATYNEGDNNYTIELTSVDDSVSTDPADYDALIVAGDEDSDSLIGAFEGAGKPTLVINPDTVEHDVEQLLRGAPAAQSNE